MKVIVLGAGRVGEAIARDLAAGGNLELTVADVSQPALDRLAAVSGLTTEMADRFDRKTGLTSMARTTGYTCTAMVNAIAEGLFTEPGLSPPEIVGRSEECYDFIMDYLEKRGIHFEVTDEAL